MYGAEFGQDFLDDRHQKHKSGGGTGFPQKLKPYLKNMLSE